MLNKRIISAAAAVAVAFGGVGAPVFGGFAQNFAITASAVSYDYETFKEHCIECGATERMIQELDAFFLPNLDYFTAADYAAFMEKTDELYNEFMLPACMAAYGKAPSELTNVERSRLIRNMGTQNMVAAYNIIAEVAAEHGVIVDYEMDAEARPLPDCTITREEIPEKEYITVSAKTEEGEVFDNTMLTVSIVDADGNANYTQNANEEGKVEVTGLVFDGGSIIIGYEGTTYAPRTVQYDSSSEMTDAYLCKYGDLDGNGTIDVDDLVLMQKKVAGWQVDSSIVYEEVANANATGEIDIDDLILEQKKVAGWNVTLGAPAASNGDVTPVIEE